MTKKENDVLISLLTEIRDAIKSNNQLIKENNELLIQSSQNDFLLTASQAAKRLSIPRNSVYNLMNNNKLSVFKIGSKKVSNSELNKFLKENNGKDLTEYALNSN